MNIGFFIMPIHPINKDYKKTLSEERDAFLLADRLGFSEAYCAEYVTDSAENITSSALFIASLAAETKNILKFASEKRNKKYCDWIVANDVSNPAIGFNSEYNAVSIISDNKIEKIGKNLKSYIANKIAKKIVNNFIQ